MEFIVGPTEEKLRENGCRDFSTARVLYRCRMALQRLGSGWPASRETPQPYHQPFPPDKSFDYARPTLISV